MKTVRPQRARTEVLRRSKDVTGTIRKFFGDGKARVDICVPALAPNHPKGIAGAAEAYLSAAKNRGGIRLLTEITGENIDYCKSLMKTADVRHMANIKGNFAVSETEYLATPSSSGFSPRGPVLYSNEAAFVRHHELLFEVLWMNATPASKRVKEIEEGLGAAKNELHYDPLQVQRLYLEMVKGAKSEVMLLLPTVPAFHRDEAIGVIALLRAAANRGVEVSVLGPADQSLVKAFPALDSRDKGVAGSVTYKAISDASSPNTATVLVVDRTASLIIEEKDASRSSFLDAVGAATYTTSEPTVTANIHFFERLREETELRIKEERSRKDAVLMQDILAHDMTNYNQVIKLNAEVLENKVHDEGLLGLVRTILRAADGAGSLIQRAKSLSKAMSQEKVVLHEVDLSRSLEDALSLVKQSNPGRTVESQQSLTPAKVVADEMLGEAFVNILSNAVEYTEGTKVPIQIRLDETEETAEDSGKKQDYWRVTITDHGRGIIDEKKRLVSRRHLESAKGSGLGLSIVRALVVDRYSGRLELKNRIDGDYTKGTSVEVWLPRA